MSEVGVIGSNGAIGMNGSIGMNATPGYYNPIYGYYPPFEHKRFTRARKINNILTNTNRTVLVTRIM
jgi:hypothetical protein